MGEVSLSQIHFFIGTTLIFSIVKRNKGEAFFFTLNKVIILFFIDALIKMLDTP